MVLPPSLLLDEVVVGNDAAWIVEFFAVDDATGEPESSGQSTFGRDDYYASVEAAMPSDLTGGRYRIVIEGMTDKHYAEIADKQKPYIRLYLFWRDNNRSVAGYVANVAGVQDVLKGVSNKPDPDTLVAVLGMTKISRRKGALTYDVEIEAREWVFDRLNRLRLEEDDVEPEETNKRFVPYMGDLLDRKGIPNEATEFEGATHIVGGQTVDTPVVETLNKIAQRVVQESRKGGRGVFLIRDGRLLIGNREFPPGDDEIRSLTTQGGLIEVNKLADFENNSGESPRRQYQVLLKGRPDIKPGSVVKVVPPENEDARTLAGKFGILGEIASEIVSGIKAKSPVDSISAFDDSEAVTLYVASVTHQLGKTTGFATTLVGIQFDPEEPWDTMLDRSDSGQSGQSGGSAASGEERLANAIEGRARTALNQKRHADVGQVRAHVTSGDDPHRHTVAVWRGTGLDGGPHQSVRLPIQKDGASRFEQTPIVTPYAWGKTGLIVPRYPGMRVVLVHRNGELSDPLDVGAVWEWEGGNPGPDAQPGDYWLILPAAVPSDKRESIADNDSPMVYTDVVTQDLIDADGHRIIEVGELVIRIGGLKNAGTRPERPSAEDEQCGVLIEHVDGESRILMKQDGTIVIKGKKIEIDAGDGDITMKAKNVKVQVGNAMDVTQS